MTDLNALKRAAAAKALEYVVDGMKLGLGSGSTAELFVEMLAPRVRGGQKLLCVPTSERTAEKARKLGITMASLDDLAPLDLTVDGADEADRNLDLIKGGGGMLLREKIVAASSKKMIVIADETKMVPRLGKFPLPVEVVEFGHKATAARLVKALEALGHVQPQLRLRQAEDEPFKTDCGNVIYDCHLGAIQNAAKLGSAIHAVPGVVEHGLFVGIATMLLVATPGEVEVINK
ncbi:MAG TPA: ribose-5-phosphate isomerase RpiA [Rhizomicrobium sp.]|jgi:ribose 5-phosphate isomerase A|nr:ribose-5-phosphate isomerase RpiA [Rhizomicrobium sp.]